MLTARRVLAFGLILLAAAGCQRRLNVTEALSLDVGVVRSLEIDPPRYEQRVTVAVETDGPVSAYLLLKKDEAAAQEALDKGRKPDHVLASWKGDSPGSLEGTVPANEVAVVILTTDTKPANVTLRITGK